MEWNPKCQISREGLRRSGSYNEIPQRGPKTSPWRRISEDVPSFSQWRIDPCVRWSVFCSGTSLTPLALFLSHQLTWNSSLNILPVWRIYTHSPFRGSRSLPLWQYIFDDSLIADLVSGALYQRRSRDGILQRLALVECALPWFLAALSCISAPLAHIIMPVVLCRLTPSPQRPSHPFCFTIFWPLASSCRGPNTHPEAVRLKLLPVRPHWRRQPRRRAFCTAQKYIYNLQVKYIFASRSGADSHPKIA